MDTTQKQRGVRHFLHGRPQDPPWERPALLALLLLTTVAYLWGLGQSGWTNSFYSAAVQAATQSWKAFFFGSLDAANFITVDKPPVSLWIMDLSARIFGLSSWSILVPQALEGVACVWVLYTTVRRWFSPGAALLAGGVLAMTPVAALMFRFNNPDALLVLLLTVSAYALTRALEAGETKWLLWASVLIGFGFLTKMLAAFIVIPGFVVVYLVFAPVSVRRRLVQMVASAVTVLVSAGWWVAIVQLTPAAARPYISSSQDNSLLNLIFGYNGLGRLTGNESGSGGAIRGGIFGGSTGLTRLFQPDMGGQISWLLPAALILLVVAAWLVRRSWRTDRALPALLIWAATLVITGLVFSFGHGTIHQYYTIALAPAVGALVGIGTDVIWRRRDDWVARIGFAVAVASTAVWSFALLDRTPTWFPWLRVAIVVVGSVAAIGIAFGFRLRERLFAISALAALVAGLAGPVAYTLDTVATPHSGPIPTAGPSVAFGGSFAGRFGGRGTGAFTSEQIHAGAGGSSGFGGPGGFTGNRATGGFRGGFGGFDAKPSQAIVRLLEQGASHYTWVAATVRATSSAPYQLATGAPIMDIGGYLGTDPAPTLAQFERYVQEGKIHYFIATGDGGTFGATLGGNTPGGRNFPGGGFSGGKMPGGGNFAAGATGRGSDSGTAITKWVESHFKATNVGGITVYDLTQTRA